MKIRMRKNTRKKTASIRFSAKNDFEGAALAKAVLAVGSGPIDSGLPVRIVEELQKNGVQKADFDLAIVEPKRRTKPKPQ